MCVSRRIQNSFERWKRRVRTLFAPQPTPSVLLLNTILCFHLNRFTGFFGRVCSTPPRMIACFGMHHVRQCVRVCVCIYAMMIIRDFRTQNYVMSSLIQFRVGPAGGPIV